MQLITTYRNPEDFLRKVLRVGRIVLERNLGIFGHLVVIVNLFSQIHRIIIPTCCSQQPLRTPYIIEIPSEEQHLPSRSAIPLPYEDENDEVKPRKKRRICGISHILGDEETYCCQKCFRQFSRKWNLERHSLSCDVILLQCPKCDRKYKKPAYLVKHLKGECRNFLKTDEPVINQRTLENLGENVDNDLKKLKIPYETGAII